MEAKALDSKFADTLGQKYVALLDMAVDQVSEG